MLNLTHQWSLGERWEWLQSVTNKLTGMFSPWHWLGFWISKDNIMQTPWRYGLNSNLDTRESHGFHDKHLPGKSSDKIPNITQFVLLAISLCCLETFLKHKDQNECRNVCPFLEQLLSICQLCKQFVKVMERAFVQNCITEGFSGYQVRHSAAK